MQHAIKPVQWGSRLDKVRLPSRPSASEGLCLSTHVEILTVALISASVRSCRLFRWKLPMSAILRERCLNEDACVTFEVKVYSQ